jgi:DNA-binding beta-propeller fold protein YncE
MKTLSSALLLVLLSIAGAGTVIGKSGAVQTLPSPALLVAEKRGGLMGVVDATTLRVIAHAPAAPSPHEVATDGRFAYVSTQGGPLITVIDLVTLKPVDGINVGAIGQVHGLVVQGGKLYFTSERARTVARYDPQTRRIDWLFGGGQGRTHMVVVTADGSKVFTTNMASGTLSIIERVEPTAGRGGRGAAAAPPDWTITAVATGAGAEGIALSPDERTVWTANVPARSLSVVDVATKQLVATMPVTTAYTNRLVFTPDGRHVLATDLRGPEVTVFDAATHKEVTRIQVGGGTEGLIVEPNGRRAFISSPPQNKVVVIDLQTLTVAGEITGLDGPDGLAWFDR